MPLFGKKKAPDLDAIALDIQKEANWRRITVQVKPTKWADNSNPPGIVIEFDGSIPQSEIIATVRCSPASKGIPIFLHDTSTNSVYHLKYPGQSDLRRPG